MRINHNGTLYVQKKDVIFFMGITRDIPVNMILRSYNDSENDDIYLPILDKELEDKMIQSEVSIDRLEYLEKSKEELEEESGILEELLQRSIIEYRKFPTRENDIKLKKIIFIKNDIEKCLEEKEHLEEIVFDSYGSFWHHGITYDEKILLFYKKGEFQKIKRDC